MNYLKLSICIFALSLFGTKAALALEYLKQESCFTTDQYSNYFIGYGRKEKRVCVRQIDPQSFLQEFDSITLYKYDILFKGLDHNNYKWGSYGRRRVERDRINAGSFICRKIPNTRRVMNSTTHLCLDTDVIIEIKLYNPKWKRKNTVFSLKRPKFNFSEGLKNKSSFCQYSTTDLYYYRIGNRVTAKCALIFQIRLNDKMFYGIYYGNRIDLTKPPKILLSKRILWEDEMQQLIPKMTKGTPLKIYEFFQMAKSKTWRVLPDEIMALRENKIIAKLQRNNLSRLIQKRKGRYAKTMRRFGLPLDSNIYITDNFSVSSRRATRGQTTFSVISNNGQAEVKLGVKLGNGYATCLEGICRLIIGYHPFIIKFVANGDKYSLVGKRKKFLLAQYERYLVEKRKADQQWLNGFTVLAGAFTLATKAIIKTAEWQRRKFTEEAKASQFWANINQFADTVKLFREHLAKRRDSARSTYNRFLSISKAPASTQCDRATKARITNIIPAIKSLMENASDLLSETRNLGRRLESERNNNTVNELRDTSISIAFDLYQGKKPQEIEADRYTKLIKGFARTFGGKARAAKIFDRLSTMQADIRSIDNDAQEIQQTLTSIVQQAQACQ